jgi:hypothetical protein
VAGIAHLADRNKTVSGVEAEAGFVGGGDGGDDEPDAERAKLPEERGQQPVADAAATEALVYVNRVLSVKRQPCF